VGGTHASQRQLFSGSITRPLEITMNTNVRFPGAKFFICIGALAACAVLAGPVRATGSDQQDRSDPGPREAGFVCTNETLRGKYGLTITGTRPAVRGGPQVSIVGTALTTFHGDGSFDQFDNINVDSPAAPFQPDRPGFGTYNLNPDCSGSMTLTAGGVTLELSIVVVDHGRELRTAVVTPNVIVTSSGRRT
jgi:hypothetical protein